MRRLQWVACLFAALVSAATVLPAETVEVASAPIRQVRGEKLKLAAQAPAIWAVGTKLRELQTIVPGQGTPAPGAIVPGSVVVRHEGRVLKAGKDYLADPIWGSLGIGPEPSVTPEDTVEVDYDYSLRRLDSKIRTADRRTIVRAGEPHLTCPQPPALEPGETRIANVFIDYHGDGKQAEVYPVLESAVDAATGTTRGRIPRVLQKVERGEPVRIVCWGDSVTAGGDASSPAACYPDVFARRLKERFPRAQITVETIAVGGSNSRQWLWPDRFPSSFALGRCDWQKIADAKPDLVTVEFVNDAGLPRPQFEEAYGEIVRRTEALGAELILITPHFTMPEWMDFKTLRETTDRRPYVLALREFADASRIALADASARWEHLWKEGLPYVTLLMNGINHPDDRGHALFADELMKCFDRP